MTESFKSVFTEDAFTGPSVVEAHDESQEVLVQKQDTGKLLGSLDIRKAMGPDGVSGWTLRKCKEQLTKPIW